MLLDSEKEAEALRLATQVTQFDTTILLDTPGYDGDFFGLRNGVIIGIPADHKAARSFPNTDCETKPDLAYRSCPSRARQHGNLKAFRKGLAELIVGQDILVFTFCAGLTSLLMKWSNAESFGVQICGSANSGKSTAASLAASAWGHPWNGGEMEDVELFTYQNLDEKLTACNDHPLILEGLERWFALEKEQKKLTNVREFDQAFHHRTSRLNGTWSRGTRILVLATSRLPIEELCGKDDAARSRLGERLVTLPVPDRTGKVFASLPDGVSSYLELIRKLNDLIAANHGVAGPKMASELVGDSIVDESALRAEIRASMDDFMSIAKVDMNDGSATRTAEKFGLVFAAGRIAQRTKVISKKLDTDTAVLECYKLHVGQQPLPSFIERVRALACDPRVVDLGGGNKLPKLSKEDQDGAIGFLRQVQGSVEFYIPVDRIETAFSDWPEIKSSMQVKRVLIRDIEFTDRNKGTKVSRMASRKVLTRGGKRIKVFAFRI